MIQSDHRLLGRALRSEAGGALPSVLVLVVVLSALVASVLMVYVAERRLVRRDLARVQARYAAEAGLHYALYQFAQNPDYRADGALVQPDGVEMPVRVWARAFGAHAEAYAMAATRTGEPLPGGTRRPHPDAEWAAVRAAVGAEAGPGYAYALVLADSMSSLTLTGAPQITGDVLTGPLGARTGQLRGRGFRGDLQGRVVQAADRDEGDRRLPLLPPVVALFAEETHRRYAQATERAAETSASFAGAVEPCPPDALDDAFVAAERLFAPGLHVVCAPDGTRLRAADVERLLPPADSLLADRAFHSGPPPLLILAEGALALDGIDLPLALPAGSIVSARTLRVRGDVRAARALFLAETVDVSGPAVIGGQILARHTARLDGGAHVGPAGVVLVSEGRRAPGRPGLDLGNVRVEGVAAFLREEPDAPRAPGTDVLLGEQAAVRGVLYTDGVAELAGRVDGSAVVAGLYFYASPAAYSNWLRAGRFDREALPEDLILPLAFGGSGDGRSARPAIVDFADVGLVDPPETLAAAAKR